jgi:hypothetical protein
MCRGRHGNDLRDYIGSQQHEGQAQHPSISHRGSHVTSVSG